MGGGSRYHRHFNGVVGQLYGVRYLRWHEVGHADAVVLQCGEGGVGGCSYGEAHGVGLYGVGGDDYC